MICNATGMKARNRYEKKEKENSRTYSKLRSSLELIY
jgi:hypothetical protein